MWIRSQDKLNLVDSSRIVVYPKPNEYEIQEQSVNGYHVILGSYSTETKVKKVLDMIQEALVDDYYGGIRVNMENTQLETYHKDIVFQMPQDSEVK